MPSECAEHDFRSFARVFLATFVAALYAQFRNLLIKTKVKLEGRVTKEIAGIETPKRYLESHYLTRELERLGVTDEQRQAMRFRGTNKGLPFDRWPFTWLGTIPYQASGLVRAYCALKWLVLENPSHSRDKEDAWRLVSETVAAPTFAMGERVRNAQSTRAKKLRGKLAAEGGTIGQVIAELAVQRQHRRKTAKELWPHLLALLNEKDLDPKEVDDPKSPQKMAYEYDFNNANGRKKITFLRFQGIVSKARREKKRVNRANDTPSVN